MLKEHKPSAYNGRAMRDVEPTFEDAFRQLEEIVRKLEAGGLPLEENLALFEEGMKLSKLCGRRLDVAELRVTEITTEVDGGGTRGTGN